MGRFRWDNNHIFTLKIERDCPFFDWTQRSISCDLLLKITNQFADTICFTRVAIKYTRLNLQCISTRISTFSHTGISLILMACLHQTVVCPVLSFSLISGSFFFRIVFCSNRQMNYNNTSNLKSIEIKCFHFYLWYMEGLKHVFSVLINVHLTDCIYMKRSMFSCAEKD